MHALLHPFLDESFPAERVLSSHLLWIVHLTLRLQARQSQNTGHHCSIEVRHILSYTLAAGLLMEVSCAVLWALSGLGSIEASFVRRHVGLRGLASVDVIFMRRCMNS